MKSIGMYLERATLGRGLGMGVILMAALGGLFIVLLDQGQLLSLWAGDVAYQQNVLHEVFHDVRHAAGFACH